MNEIKEYPELMKNYQERVKENQIRASIALEEFMLDFEYMIRRIEANMEAQKWENKQ